MRLVTPLIAALAMGCGAVPNLDDRTAREFVVTQRDPAVDFQSFSTFAIVPSVSLISDAGDAGVITPIESQVIIDRTIQNLVARGYVQVERGASPDLGVNVSALVLVNSATVVNPGFWWGAPGYSGTPASWGFPGGSYGSGFTYTSVAYKSGTLIVDIVDLRDAPESPTIDVTWTAIAHGFVALGGTLAPDAPAAIDQAFIQSPYLSKN